MVEHNAKTRNDAIEFAQRTRRNLEYIDVAAKQGQNVHPVTQLTLSLLGLVVFPKERTLLKHEEGLTLEEMNSEGWPHWAMLKDEHRDGPTTNLKILLTRIRNAICHARVRFNSDSRSIDDVNLTIEDGPKREPSWIASISGSDLREFCYRFIDFVDRSIG
jgi:hypothetical protein